MSEKLKPCPFCGGEISLKHHEFEGEETMVAFVCPEQSTCRQHKNGPHMLFVAQGSELEEAIKLWNTRANHIDDGGKSIHAAIEDLLADLEEAAQALGYGYVDILNEIRGKCSELNA